MTATTTEIERASAMVRRLADKHVGAYAISDALIEEIEDDPQLVLAMLRETLPTYVRERLGAQRREHVDLSGVEELDQATPDDGPSGTSRTYEADDGSHFVSPKLRAIHDAYARRLATQFGTEHGMRPLGSLTEADLTWAARERRRQAAGHLAEASRLDALRDALVRYQRTTVAELPPVVVREIMERP